MDGRETIHYSVGLFSKPQRGDITELYFTPLGFYSLTYNYTRDATVSANTCRPAGTSNNSNGVAIIGDILLITKVERYKERSFF